MAVLRCCSRKTCCQSDQCRRGYQPWCHLGAGVNCADLSLDFRAQTNSLHYSQEAALSKTFPSPFATICMGTHEHLPEGLLWSDPQEIANGSGRSRHGSAIRMRLSAKGALEAVRNGGKRRNVRVGWLKQWRASSPSPRYPGNKMLS